MNESQFLSSKVHSRVEKINTDADTNFTFLSTMVTLCGESTQTREESSNPVWKEECKRSQKECERKEVSLATLKRVGPTEMCSHGRHQYKEQWRPRVKCSRFGGRKDISALKSVYCACMGCQVWMSALPYKLGMGPLRGTQRKITQVCYMPAEIKIMSSRFSERLYFKRTYQRMIEDI